MSGGQTATRRFVRSRVCVRQRSSWAIIKFRMLLWIANGLGGGSPTSSNSSAFKAALRIYVSRILKRDSENVDCLRDVVKHYLLRATMGGRLRGAGGRASCYLTRQGCHSPRSPQAPEALWRAQPRGSAGESPERAAGRAQPRLR